MGFRHATKLRPKALFPWAVFFHSPWMKTMNRCALTSVVAASVLLFGSQVIAQQSVRPFPANALRATMVVGQPPEITLNDQPARLSPGARIRGENNLVHLSGSIVGQRLVVHYTTDTLGLVHNVWVLTPEELSRRPWPSTAEEAQRWLYDADARVWTRR